LIKEAVAGHGWMVLVRARNLESAADLRRQHFFIAAGLLVVTPAGAFFKLRPCNQQSR